MSVMQYCMDIQAKLQRLRPEPIGHPQDDPHFMQWFGDTGRASQAVTEATMNHRSKALQLAEPIAERWDII